MSRSCDMFESQVNSNNCKFLAHSQRKFTNIYELLKPKLNAEIYVLQCSPVSENLLDNSDYFFHTHERKSLTQFDLYFTLKILSQFFIFLAWIVDSTCDNEGLVDRLNFQNKYAGNSFPSYQYMQRIKCNTGNRIQKTTGIFNGKDTLVMYSGRKSRGWVGFGV